MDKNRAVLYLRLSKEDSEKLNKGDESASIKNQRLLLTDYALEKDFKIVNVYSDDDESGLFDNRPGFEKMIMDAKTGEFDVIIAKTQSRFSRNMEHIEKYLHHDLPNLGIRFIGVADGTDTANEANKKARQINGLVNEWYCEDLSKNVRSAFKAKMRDGQFLGSSCPYGYKKDPKNHNHLIIDEYAAEVVREIYRLYLQGHGKAKIGSILSSAGIMIPTLYKKQVLGENYYNSKILDTTKVWSYQTIHMILNNRTYIGDLIQNRYNTYSYKDKKKRKLPESEWIIVKGTHEPIIDKETFDRVQELQKIRTKEVKNDKAVSVFSGLIICADCKKAMTRKYNRRGNHEFTGYVCNTYKTCGKKFCSSHSIDIDLLEEAVLNSIRSEARKILRDSDIDELNHIQVKDNHRKFVESEIASIDKQIEKAEGYKKKTYDNLMDEIISKEEYVKYIEEYNQKISDLKEQKEVLIDELNAQDCLDEKYNEWVESFKDYINIKKLTREVVLELINKIAVHEDGTIDIYYRFSNPYE